MKFLDFANDKSTETAPCYLIEGDDRYICYKALSALEDKLNLNFKELNMNILEGSDLSMSKVLNACYTLPFADLKRLVVVKDYSTRSTDSEQKMLENYLKNPTSEVVLAFFCTEPSPFFKKIKDKMTVIDCNKLEGTVLEKWVRLNAKKQGASITGDGTVKLINFCNGGMSKISSELSKLSSYVGEGGIITEDLIEKLVVPEREYHVFEIAENIAKGNADKALSIVNYLTETDKNPLVYIPAIYSHFRRLFYIAVSKLNDNELSVLFNIKPFAVKMLRAQMVNFSAKQLKKIVDLIAEADINLKTGKLSREDAVKIVILNILMLR